MEIRPAGGAAFKVIAALYGACFEDDWPEPSVAELMNSPGVWGLVAMVDATPAGFVLARVIAREAEILAIGTVPAQRRAGLARALMTRAIAIAAPHADAMFLEVGADNPSARALYLSLDFHEVGLRRDYYRRADGRRVDARILKCEF
ncbi:GNAT family N-acetyltransferase [Marivibrio halodurans]|uniref:GNAT family N-acetyltransferase n=1 Tax=Marivibrio halodurans TaxID=2039722 RepID=A0A8J7V3Q1_9PROT|nr:GNAT family N-acetyltransferase [Marivibrio halodurans]